MQTRPTVEQKRPTVEQKRPTVGEEEDLLEDAVMYTGWLRSQGVID